MADSETIADIIAEMRRGTRLPGFWRSCDLNKILQYHAGRLEAAHKCELSKNTSKNGADFGQLGDAAKLREALEFCVKGMCGFCRMDAEARGMTTECVNGCEALRKAKAALAAPATAEESSAVGDAAKLREALVDIKSEAETTSEYCDYPIAGNPSERGCCKVVDADYLIEKCKAALSAPPRNCDKYATAEEARQAWLLAPATEKEGGAK